MLSFDAPSVRGMPHEDGAREEVLTATFPTVMLEAVPPSLTVLIDISP